jgi:hypothetical protein
MNDIRDQYAHDPSWYYEADVPAESDTYDLDDPTDAQALHEELERQFAALQKQQGRPLTEGEVTKAFNWVMETGEVDVARAHTETTGNKFDLNTHAGRVAYQMERLRR